MVMDLMLGFVTFDYPLWVWLCATLSIVPGDVPASFVRECSF